MPHAQANRSHVLRICEKKKPNERKRAEMEAGDNDIFPTQTRRNKVREN